ncbi:isochorismate synthase [Rariglobus hedericola]|uniref:isochorismate synthase n=1 Tax=Rariglobus hedericola TaxID=2597822 RepID=A0A556QNJ7_9BACT|nr:isochorismate synthase [Rariglobus hedericola]TSJ78220.1 isochorismate synthase [Rariglobus hedericola]
MTILPINPTENASPDALIGFLRQCREAARGDGRERLVSISIQVGALDPLAVLEAIFESGELHFYAERPNIHTAIAGAEAVLVHEASGPERFESAQRFIDDVLARTIAVGDVDAPFGGPHFFSAFTFLDQVEQGEAFPAARVFVPRWQVARAGEVTTAVANLLVAPDSDLATLAERVLRAHGKFKHIDYDAKPAVPVTSQPCVFQTTEAGDFRTTVKGGLAAIAAGVVKKIVLARVQDMQTNAPLHPLRLLNGLRERFPECYSFSVANGRGQSFIGASPERLVRVSKGVLETEALAGSARRGQSASEDAALGAELLASEKDRREQGHVLESIVRRLEPLGFAPQFPSQPVLRKLANVQHLHTPVSAVMPAGIHLLDALARLHPTPAVGGSPREEAVARIRDLEGFPRGLYAGAIGWLNARGGGEFLVGIRSALVEGRNARVYAGAGIVAGSDPEREFAETELKFRAMREALLG